MRPKPKPKTPNFYWLKAGDALLAGDMVSYKPYKPYYGTRPLIIDSSHAGRIINAWNFSPFPEGYYYRNSKNAT